MAKSDSSSTDSRWLALRRQLDDPSCRVYGGHAKHRDAAPHAGIVAFGGTDTPMDLPFDRAQALLREALHCPEQLSLMRSSGAEKLPSLWAIAGTRVYRFHFDGNALWHGYPENDRRPPASVVRRWLAGRLVTRALYKEINRRRS